MRSAGEGLAEGNQEGLARALGIDFGEKRIGLAISDPDGRLAVPLATLARRSDRAAAAAIAQLARSEGVRRLVLGEPLSADGLRGPAAQRVRRFGARLAAAAGLPLTYVDETLTSVEAAARLRAAGVDLRRQPERIDAAAAQILLQEDLDRAAARTPVAPGEGGAAD
jgi:putative holliday junction resolvase